MKFPDPLIPGTLIKRYKRFLADVTLADGTEVTAHCANPGSMLSVDAPGSAVWVSPARNPERKLRYTWELIEVAGALVGINTFHPNAIVAEAIASGAVPELAGYEDLRREVKYGENSRIDILLEDGAKAACYVEVKNVTMKRGDEAEFPDSVTKRGAKHLGELARVVAAGGRAVMFYLVQRGDCDVFTVAGDIDPAYESALAEARAAGVEAVAYACEVTPEGVEVARRLDMRA